MCVCGGGGGGCIIIFTCVEVVEKINFIICHMLYKLINYHFESDQNLSHKYSDVVDHPHDAWTLIGGRTGMSSFIGTRLIQQNFPSVRTSRHAIQTTART